MKTSLLSNYLLRSWERSKAHGASLEKAKDAFLQGSELQLHQEKIEELLTSIRPSMEQLATSLKSSNSAVIISNSSGILLENVGELPFLQEPEKIHVQKGACWAEQVRGTNSAGTVSVEEKSLAVIGREHYLTPHHNLYCAGSPIFKPTGEMEAVLNISGHSSVYHPSLLGMVDVIARNFENWRLIRQPKKQLVISLYPEQEKHYEALLAVDEHGEIIGLNREARRLLQIKNISNNTIYLQELFSNTNELLQGKGIPSPHLVQLQPKDNETKSLLSSVVLDSRSREFAFSERKKVAKQFPVTKKSTSTYTFDEIYGEDPTFQAALSTAKRAASTNYTVVITGESGTGKEMISQAIHQASSRSAKPFVALNCGGIPKSLAESELFGYEAGAYTGAKQSGQPGVFEQANGGTLFLDEIAELPMEIQITLLRVLQDFKVRRIGGLTPVQVDVRLITATHTNLWEKVKEGSFRADLFYRLQGVSVELPPLREREDRLQFARGLLFTTQKELHRQPLTFSPAAEQFILNYSWPGNVRQMSSAIREAVFSSTEDSIDVSSFPSYMLSSFQETETMGSLLQDAENKIIIETMNKTNGNITKAANILGIGRNTLYRKLGNLSWETDKR